MVVACESRSDEHGDETMMEGEVRRASSEAGTAASESDDSGWRARMMASR